MKRQLTSILLFSALLVGGASTFVSCTDHESDSAYNTSISLADAIAKQKAELTDLNNELAKKVDKTTDALEKKALSDRIKANEDALSKGALAELGRFASLDLAIQQTRFYTKEFQGVKDQIKALEEFRKNYPDKAEDITKDLEDKFKTLDQKVSDEAEAQEALNEAYNTAFDYLINKNLQNIAINATENPVLGYYNAAFLGSKLNLVSSFYGTAAQTSQDWGIEKNDFLNNGDAGKIYITLNPNEIDPKCITDLKLVDSQGNEAKGFKLGDIQTTDKVLTYGFTKAASANGFYEVPVLATDPANDDFSLNKGELKEAAKNIVAKLQNPKESNLNLSQIATTLYRSVNNQLKAYTVKATYYLYDPTVTNEDGTKGALVEKHQVAPTYDMAAFAVKPLSFNTLKGNQSLKNLGLALDKYMIPTLSDKLGKFMDALDVQVELSEDKKNLNVYTIVALADVTVQYDNATKKAWFEKNGAPIAGSEIKNVTEVELITSTDLEGGHVQNVYKIKTTDSTIADVVKELNDQLSTKLQPVKDAIQNAANKWDSAIQPVNTLLHKINAKIGNVNELLQPTLLYKSTKTNSWNTLSTLGGKLGTRMTGINGSTVLVATSWTGELLAPAYKKKVYVKETGANVTLMDGKTSAKTPFSGSTQKVLFTAEKPGRYTIVYEAVDYSGVSAKPKEYHITVE